MTILMTATFDIDPARLEAVAKDSGDTLRVIIRSAKEHGLIAHRFYGNENTVLVVDQWPDEESFRGFFADAPQIGELMAKAGGTGEPRITVYRQLDVDDVVEPIARGV